MMRRTQDATTGWQTLEPRAAGFTLVELLVVIGILLLITTLSVTAVSVSLNGDRTRAASRQVQSYLAGARDRAIFAKAPRGVRLLLDATDATAEPTRTRTVSRLVYIGQPDDFATGTITVDTTTVPGEVRIVPSTNPAWSQLQARGLLPSTRSEGVVRIQIPYDPTNPSLGAWYPLVHVEDTVTPANSYWRLTSNEPTVTAGTGIRYRLRLLATQLPNVEPVVLPRSTVIDLDGSAVPAGWRPSATNPAYAQRMDILFAPDGRVTNLAGDAGIVHLLVADEADMTKARSSASGRGGTPINWAGVGVSPLVPVNGGATVDLQQDMFFVTLFPQTGSVSSHPVDPTDGDANRWADLPTRFALKGEVAGK